MADPQTLSEFTLGELRRRRAEATTPRERLLAETDIAKALRNPDYAQLIGEIGERPRGTYSTGGHAAAQAGLAAASFAPAVAALGPAAIPIGLLGAGGLGLYGVANLLEGRRRQEARAGGEQMGLGALDLLTAPIGTGVKPVQKGARLLRSMYPDPVPPMTPPPSWGASMSGGINRAVNQQAAAALAKATGRSVDDFSTLSAHELNDEMRRVFQRGLPGFDASVGDYGAATVASRRAFQAINAPGSWEASMAAGVNRAINQQVAEALARSTGRSVDDFTNLSGAQLNAEFRRVFNQDMPGFNPGFNPEAAAAAARETAGAGVDPVIEAMNQARRDVRAATAAAARARRARARPRGAPAPTPVRDPGVAGPPPTERPFGGGLGGWGPGDPRGQAFDVQGAVPVAARGQAYRASRRIPKSLQKGIERVKARNIDKIEESRPYVGGQSLDLRSTFSPEGGFLGIDPGEAEYLTGKGRLASIEYLERRIKKAIKTTPSLGRLGTSSGQRDLAKLISTGEGGIGRLFANVDLRRAPGTRVRAYAPGEPFQAGEATLRKTTVRSIWASATPAEKKAARESLNHHLVDNPERLKWVREGGNETQREALAYYLAYHRVEAGQELLRLHLRRSHTQLDPLWRSSPPTGVPQPEGSMHIDTRSNVWGRAKDLQKGRKVPLGEGGFLSMGNRKVRKAYLSALMEWESALTLLLTAMGASAVATGLEGEPSATAG